MTGKQEPGGFSTGLLTLENAIFQKGATYPGSGDWDLYGAIRTNVNDLVQRRVTEVQTSRLTSSLVNKVQGGRTFGRP
ncbi:unnamed protein product [Blepharisma stoltei]|uniref:Uncharacterized protein n=1 Tax=Blepharisma stoltei TaxID=1481888 RepID=A0AAU9J7G8_9CILI|nr:unnamed protein product [Blepharisma stoltei]